MWEQINDYWQLLDSETGAVAEVRELNTGLWLCKVESYILSRKAVGMKESRDQATQHAEEIIEGWR